jgi:hypothetical protein
VVAGTRFTFDLEMGPNQNRTDCPPAPPGAPALQVHTVKKVCLFPVPSQDVTDQTLSGRI